MCGIAGRVSLANRPLDVAPLGAMMDLVSYRGPDDQGYALFGLNGQPPRSGKDSADLRNGSHPDVRVALGHRRLSIIDLSEDARQPMSYDDGRLWVAFNGEVYNYVELREELRVAGYEFHTQSDTEVIPAAYDRWGLDCVDHFNGMFSIVIWDCGRRKLVCFRDRLGIKPFYYTVRNEVFDFGSEIKQLLEAGAPRKIHPARAFDHLVFDTTDHHEETCFSGIRQLLPSHRLVIDFDRAGIGSLRIDRYWEPKRLPEVQSLDTRQAAECVRDLMIDSVRLRMRSDVPLGSCLSGGLDSSSIVCLMGRIRAEQGLDFVQHTFTYQPDDKSIDESYYADLVSEQVGAVRNITGVELDDLVRSLDRHLWYEEEPLANLSHFARARVMALAKRTGVTVVLDGQGGDELFLGYERYYVPAFLLERKTSGLVAALREFRLSTRNSALGMGRMLAYALMFGNARVRARVLRRRADAWINPDFLKRHDVLALAREYHLGLDIWEMQRRELFDIQLPHLLRHEDRDSMASSIEARVPLLDHRLVEFVMSLRPQAKIHDGWTKYCLRLAMEGILPGEVQWRRDKLGFNVPESRWLRALESHVRTELTGDLACEPFVDRDKLGRGLQSGSLDGRTLWRILSLEKMMRIFSLSA